MTEPRWRNASRAEAVVLFLTRRTPARFRRSGSPVLRWHRPWERMTVDTTLGQLTDADTFEVQE